MKIRLIATGGTFDKHYDPQAGALGFDQSHLPAILQRVRAVDAGIAVEVAMLIDSLDMQDSHRQDLLARCSSAAEAHLVIVHGTDTMVQTAAVLAAAALPKTVLLTGAMVPYELTGSDALFNLGFALGSVGNLPAGVYIAMNARVHAWDQVHKNRQLGVFEAGSS